MVQGLPFGFQATTLTVLLRREGVSNEVIGLAGALAFPWMLKLLWAPLVERWSIARIGRRRTWILPLTLALALLCAAASFFDPHTELAPLVAILLAMNLCSATMDIAVDGLAVDLLAPHELGPGNAAQVGGFKLGMIATGGILLANVHHIGWSGFFAIEGALIGIVWVSAMFWREPPSRIDTVRVGDIVKVLIASVRKPGFGWVLLFIATYKIGESASDTMFGSFLVDRGYDDAQIGTWVGSWGMLASTAGSIAGGFARARIPIVRAIAMAAALRAIPIFGESWIATVGPTDAAVIAITLQEHFFGGLLTTLMFAFMMKHVDRSIGATHFTALATVELFGKAPSRLISGYLVRALDYAGTFAVAGALSLAFLLIAIPMRRAQGTGGVHAPGPL